MNGDDEWTVEAKRYDPPWLSQTPLRGSFVAVSVFHNGTITNCTTGFAEENRELHCSFTVPVVVINKIKAALENAQ